MIKLETHCHTIGLSPCGDTENNILIQKYLDASYGGIVVTNHFGRPYYDEYLMGNTQKEKVDFFFNVYDVFSRECKDKGIKTFFGAEVRVKDLRNPRGTEFTVIGLPRSVYYNEPFLFDLTQEQLFELCESYGAFMYQTHPFRTAVCLGNPKYMHGAESFNGHYHHVNNNDLAEKFCLDNGLIGLSGTDFHHNDQPITAGIYLPENIDLESELVEYLFNNEFEIIKEDRKYLECLKEFIERK